jgi:2-succinyl-5-enolpyruvyl-6-hydroxy-3-cyclohexene-1-carboxylate synthase
MYGADYVRVETREAFRTAFRSALTAEKSWVIEVVSDRMRNHRCHREIVEAVKRQVVIR